MFETRCNKKWNVGTSIFFENRFKKQDKQNENRGKNKMQKTKTKCKKRKHDKHNSEKEAKNIPPQKSLHTLFRTGLEIRF